MSKLLIFGLVAGGLYFMSKSNSKGSKREELRAFFNRKLSGSDKVEMDKIVSRFTDAEVNTVHTFIFQYLEKNKTVPKDSQLYKDMTTISLKYNIFT